MLVLHTSILLEVLHLLVEPIFDKLFPGNRFVFGDFNAGPATKTRVCIGRVKMEPLRTKRGEPRALNLEVNESVFGPKVMGYDHLFATLREVKNKGESYDTGFGGSSWPLKPGENATDGAIRIGRSFFKLINLRTEPVIRTIDDLMPLFVVYQYTLAFQKGWWHSLETVLRQKHGLKEASLLSADWIDSLSSFSRRPGRDLGGVQSCSGCDRFGKVPVKIGTPNENVRVVFCGTCHRSWFCTDVEKALWQRVDNEVARLLSIQFNRLEL